MHKCALVGLCLVSVLTVNVAETGVTWEKGKPEGDCLYHSWQKLESPGQRACLKETVFITLGKTHLNCEWYLGYVSGKRQLKISMYSCTQCSLLTLNIT